MSLKERQERDRQRIQKAILDAARALFIAEGYQHVSMRKIAERIDYSPAAIYSYFPAKDDIFFALAAEGFHILAQAVSGAIRGVEDPFERLRRGLWAFYQFAKTHPEYFALMFLDRSVPSLSQDFQRFEFFQQLTARAEDDIRACVHQRLTGSLARTYLAAGDVAKSRQLMRETITLLRSLRNRQLPPASSLVLRR